MKKIAVVLFALAVTCLSGEPPAGKSNGTVLLGKTNLSEASSGSERLEVYEDWDRGYFVYKQINHEDNENRAGDIVSISITAVPIRTDWPASQRGEPPKQRSEDESGK